MTIRWFTDADRQDMRDAAEERRFLAELYQKYWTREVTAEERAERIAYSGEMCGVRIDPYRLS